MSSWPGRSEAIKNSLKLRTEPIGFRRLQDAAEPENIEGMNTLASIDFGYPIPAIGGFADPNPFLDQLYPDRKRD